MLFSERFNIKKGESEFWFDPVLETDVELFIDPYLMENSEIDEFKKSRDKIIDFFQYVFEKIIKAKAENHLADAKRILKNILIFPEVSELCLGYAKNTLGSGTSSGFAGEIYQAITDYLFEMNMDPKEFRHIEFFGIFSSNIAHDRISDITANILKEELINYTQKICKRYKVPLKRCPISHYKFNKERGYWEEGYFKLPWNEFTNKPILLVPEIFLRRSPTFNHIGFLRYLVNSESESLRSRFSVSIIEQLDKQKLKNIIKSNPSFLYNYIQEKYGEGKVALSYYDLGKDENFLYYRYIYPKKLAESLPPLFSNLTKDDNLHLKVVEMANRFKDLIENHGGEKFLWRPREDAGHFPEGHIRDLFNLTIHYKCEEEDIDVSLETRAGRGKIEFKFSQGFRARTHLEIKIAENPNLTHGFQQQLPDYMKSERITKGVFMVVYFTEEGKENLEKLKEKIRKMKEKENLEIILVDIDARKKFPPSRIMTIQQS